MFMPTWSIVAASNDASAASSDDACPTANVVRSP
jgi:hypothetical protein